MLRRLGLAIYRGFFWTYERGTWQYDIMCFLIVAFILFTPRSWFNDKPLTLNAPTSDVVLLLNEPSQKIYQLRAALLDATSDAPLKQGIQTVLRSFTGKSMEITRIEPAERDSRGQVISYEVWVRE